MGKKNYLLKGNILGLTFWGLIIIYLFFNFDFLDLYLSKLFFFIKKYSFYFIFSYYLIIFLSMKYKLNLLLKLLVNSAFLFIYVILFPIIILYSQTAKYILSLYTYKNAWLKHFLHLFFFLFFILFYSAIITFENQFFLILSIICLGISLYFYQMYLLYWFNDPSLFTSFPKYMFEKYQKDELFKNTLFESYILFFLKILLNPRLWFFILITGFLIGLSLTVVNFTFIYYGLTKIDNLSFFGLESYSFLGHLYFTISNFSTINYGNVIPTTSFAKITVILQIFSAILLFSIIISSFAFSSSQERVELIKQINLRIKAIKDNLGVKEDIDLLKKIVRERKNKN